MIPWNPFTNAGDRHELLVSLKITLAPEPSRGGWSVGGIVGGEFKWLAHDEDEARDCGCGRQNGFDDVNGEASRFLAPGDSTAYVTDLCVMECCYSSRAN